ncbi:hypothetical protein BZG36_01312 [Bifiguratus adelaidae]|uniref:Uncharacterized protein n=1 Tax=Bifiguratus adelaidae TaxID=1938954 RepID=A0A261Y593_9FUNG|nr:hypothetical protein BZG36_01312 [Bifiguratus adelaidae]
MGILGLLASVTVDEVKSHRKDQGTQRMDQPTSTKAKFARAIKTYDQRWRQSPYRHAARYGAYHCPVYDPYDIYGYGYTFHQDAITFWSSFFFADERENNVRRDNHQDTHREQSSVAVPVAAENAPSNNVTRSTCKQEDAESELEDASFDAPPPYSR